MHLCSYLHKINHTVLCFRTRGPDFSDLPAYEYGWGKTVYVRVHEEIPTDIPEQLGKLVVPSHYVGANFFHNIRSAGLLQVFN